jgi:transcriptional regulator
VEIEITGIEGKWKVSQNRPKADIAEVVEGLGATAEVHANPGMADLVRRYGADR